MKRLCLPLAVLVILLMLQGCQLSKSNIYDPKKIEIDDRIGKFSLEHIVFNIATESYPIDTVSAYFLGEAIVEGTLVYVEADGEFSNQPLLTFIPNLSSSSLIPISHHEKTFSPIIFTNELDVVKSLNIKPGQSIDSVRLAIDGYTNHFLATDAFNMTTFVRVVD